MGIPSARPRALAALLVTVLSIGAMTATAGSAWADDPDPVTSTPAPADPVSSAETGADPAAAPDATAGAIVAPEPPAESTSSTSATERPSDVDPTPVESAPMGPPVSSDADAPASDPDADAPSGEVSALRLPPAVPPPTCEALPTTAAAQPTTCVPADSPPRLVGGGFQVGPGFADDYAIPLLNGEIRTGTYVEFPVALPTIPQGPAACNGRECERRAAARLYLWDSRSNRFSEVVDTEGIGYRGVGPYSCVVEVGCAGPYWARFDTTYYTGPGLDYYLSSGIAPRYLLVEDLVTAPSGFQTMYFHRFSLVEIPWDDAGAPTAAFTAADDTTTPGRVLVTSTSTDAVGDPTFDTWDFGDGTTGTGRFTSHDYTTPGSYTITLTARDGSGRTATTTRDVTIAAPQLSTSVQIVGASPPLREDADVRVRVSARASADGVGDLSELVFADASPLRISPATAFSTVRGPDPAAPDAPFSLAPGETRTWEYTLRSSLDAVGRYVLSTSLSGRDAAGTAVSSEAISPGEIGQSLRVDISVDPAIFTLEEDADGSKPRDVTVTERITNTTDRTMTQVTLRSLEPQNVVSGQLTSIAYTSGVKADPVTGTPLADIPPRSTITITAVYTVSDDATVDFASVVSARAADGTEVTGSGTARMVANPHYLMRFESHVVTPSAGLLPAGTPIVVTGTVENLTGGSTLDLTPMFAQLSGNAGVQSFAWDMTGVPPTRFAIPSAQRLGPGETAHFTVQVQTAYSEAVTGTSPLTTSPVGGTQATVLFTPWATVTREDGTTAVTDAATDILTTPGDLRHRIAIDDSITLPAYDPVVVAGATLRGGAEGVWNAGASFVGLATVPFKLGSSWYALYDYQEQVWSSFSEEEKRAFSDAIAAYALPVLLANAERAGENVDTLFRQASDHAYRYFTQAENDWRVGDYALTAEKYAALSSDALAQVVVPVAIGRLARSAAAAEAANEAQLTITADGATAAAGLTDASTVEETVASVTRVASGVELSAEQVRLMYGIDADELARLQQIARERNILIVVRSRSTSSLDWIRRGAKLKPEVIKIKSVSPLDVALGYPAEYEGALVFKEPVPLQQFRAGGGDLEELIGQFVESKGFRAGTAEYDDAVSRVGDRIAEWNKYSTTYQQWNQRGWVETSFNWTGNAASAPAAAVDRGAYQGFRLQPTGVEGESVVQLLDGRSGRFVEVTGDIDPIAFTRTDGTALSIEEHTSLLNDLRRDPLLRAQHGESTTYVKGGLQFVQSQFKPNEAGLMLTPSGTPRAVRLNLRLSTWNSATDYRMVWDGGVVDAGVRPIGPVSLVGPDIGALTAPPAAAPVQKAAVLPKAVTPGAANVGRCSVSYAAGGQALVMTAGGVIGAVSGQGVAPSPLASVCFSEGPVVPVVASPATELSDDVSAGQTELPVLDTAAVAAPGTGGLRVGQTVVIDPGGADAETGTVSAFGSIILAAPLVRAHPAGTPIVVTAEPAGAVDPVPPSSAVLLPGGGASEAGSAAVDASGRAGTLPRTGADDALPTVVLGALLLFAGAGLAFIRRRREPLTATTRR